MAVSAPSAPTHAPDESVAVRVGYVVHPENVSVSASSVSMTPNGTSASAWSAKIDR